MADIVFVGLATDGPSNIALIPESERELISMFGGNYTERFQITPTTTGSALSYLPFDLPVNSYNGLADSLYSPYVSGGMYHYGSVGVTGGTLDVTYNPYVGKSDLVFAARKYLAETGQMPYVLRIGGTPAEVEVDGFKFSSRYAGSRYNQVTLEYDGTDFKISGLAPNYPDLVYSDLPIDILEMRLAYDANTGISPVRLETKGLVLNPFTATLSGGTDGSFSDTEFNQFTNLISLPDTVTHVIALSTVTSAMVTDWASLIAAYGTQPRVLIVNSPEYTSDIYDLLVDMQTNIPFRHSYMVVPLGTVDHVFNNVTYPRYACESIGIGLRKYGFNSLTNLKLPTMDFYPKLNEQELEDALRGGLCPLMRYIGNDVSVYKGNVFSTTNSYLYTTKATEIMSVATAYCRQFINKSIARGAQAQLAQALKTLLDTISWVTINSVEITVYTEYMYVDIVAELPNEILHINFSVKNH